MDEDKEKYIFIKDKNDLNYLLERIEKGINFAEAFKFEKDSLFISFLDNFGVNYDEYKKNYFYYDKGQNLHISCSEFGYTWISTYGLIAKGKVSSNNFVNSCLTQYTVLSLIFNKAIEVSDSKNVYDVDGYNFGYLMELTPALFHNTLFYIEIFGKAYLSLSGVDVPHTHDLSQIYSLVDETMHFKKHNDSLFQLHIIAEFRKTIEYITSIPDFKEHFVKYDDNLEDHTIIVFDPEYLRNVKKIIDISYGFIHDYNHEGDKANFLKSGVFQRLLNKAITKEEKQKIINAYGYMIN